MPRAALSVYAAAGAIPQNVLAAECAAVALPPPAAAGILPRSRRKEEGANSPLLRGEAADSSLRQADADWCALKWLAANPIMMRHARCIKLLFAQSSLPRVACARCPKTIIFSPPCVLSFVRRPGDGPGNFEANLASLNLREGLDYLHFS